MRNLRLLVAVLCLLVGCAQVGGSPDGKSELAQLQAREDNAERRLELAEEQLALHRTELMLLRSAVNQRSYGFDPSDTTSGFGIVAADIGNVLVQPSAVEKSGNGSRLTLSLGNTTAATFTSSALRVQYGASQSTDMSDAQWESSLREVSIAIPQKVPPATWSTVEVALPGVPPEQLGYVRVTPNIQRVSLLKGD